MKARFFFESRLFRLLLLHSGNIFRSKYNKMLKKVSTLNHVLFLTNVYQCFCSFLISIFSHVKKILRESNIILNSFIYESNSIFKFHLFDKILERVCDYFLF